VIPCSVLERCHSFRGPRCFHLHWPLKRPTTTLHGVTSQKTSTCKSLWHRKIIKQF